MSATISRTRSGALPTHITTSEVKGQDNAANTLRLGAGMGLRLWRGADLALNYERVVAKPSGEPVAQTVRFTIRQLW